MRRALLLTTLVSLPVPLAADAATRHVVRGGGFGHGIGLSQYGAHGFAQRGRSYRQIVQHYYRGTKLASARSEEVRVLLQWNDSYVRVAGASRLGSRKVSPAKTYVVRPARGGRLGVSTSDGRRVGSFGPPLRFSRGGSPLRLLGPAINGVGSGLYRGTIELLRGASGVHAINALPIDPYVQGVVPGEMPSSWHMEALKAQAVVARSYAMATDKPGPFDQYPDTRSQVYRGVTGETSRTNGAVQATAGEILTYGGAPAVTYYFSTSGGHTENVELSFLGAEPQPYLKGVDDPYDAGPYHRWTFRFTTAQMDARLGRYSPGRFRKMTVLERGASPRIVRARVHGSGGTRIITGPQIRALLGLYDSWASFTRASTSQARRKLSLAASWYVRPLVLVGRFDPAPSGRRLTVERRSGGSWRRVGRVRTTRRGRYRVAVRERGVYRVRSRTVAGPRVRVR
jgi:stage II sporulation protein D